jgi:hypothetical protein
VIPLRPLGVGEILDGAISTIRAHPAVMLGLSAMVAAVSQLVTVPVTWLALRDVGDTAFSFDQPSDTGDEIAFTASALSAGGIALVVSLVAGIVLAGILTVVVSRAVLGQRIGGGEAWRLARPRLPALLGVTAVVMLLMLGVATLALLPALALALVSVPTALPVLAAVLGALLALGVGVYLYVALALAPASVVLERQSVLAALRRSRRLVAGAWWRTFGILLLVNVIAQVVGTILSVPFALASAGSAFLSGDGASPYALLPLVVQGVGTVVAATITWPFTAAATVLLYVDRRIRREGLDLELARASGTSAEGGAAAPGPPAGHPGGPPPGG